MPSANKHREWAKRTEELYDYIGGAASYWGEWAATLLFYAALHEIQAFLVDQTSVLDQHGLTVPDTHHDRKSVLRKLWPDLAAYYQSLERRSRSARYGCKAFSETEIKFAHVALTGTRTEIERLGADTAESNG
jgi:hypothetical protein